MGDKTAIEWTDATWNPLIGCSRVSAGCDNCYAIRVAHRGMAEQHRGLTVQTEGRIDWTGEVRPVPHVLDQPLRWRKPRRIFVNSLSDLFHRDVRSHVIADVFRVMARCPQHTFQVLTKRPERMAAWVAANNEITVPTLPNVWLGTSIENDRYTFRADRLRATPAAVRFLSLEPLLGPLPSLDLSGIDWVIVGGESGPGARPMHPAWVRDIRDRCTEAGVAFLFKQWGDWTPDTSIVGPARNGRFLNDSAGPAFVRRVGKKAAGRTLDGRTWDEFPGEQS